MIVRGKVHPGNGVASRYVTDARLGDAFRLAMGNRLRLAIVPGTLNVRCDGPLPWDRMEQVQAPEGIATCLYPARLRVGWDRWRVLLIRGSETTQPERLAEVVGTIHFRSALRLADGAVVALEFPRDVDLRPVPRTLRGRGVLRPKALRSDGTHPEGPRAMSETLVYQAYVGPRRTLYDHCTASVRAYAESIGSDYIVQTEPALRISPDPATSGRSEGTTRLGYLPILEKWNALAHLERYDAVAVIDADIWARPGSPSIFDAVDEVADFGGVIERDLPLTSRYRAKLRAYSEGQYGPLGEIDWNWEDGVAEHFNGGVMVLRSSLTEFVRGETPAEFIGRPEHKRFVDGRGAWKWSTDQTMANWWLRSCGAMVDRLDWRWNCMFGAVENRYLPDAHFVHFFLSDHLRCDDPAVLLERGHAHG